eukprot:TRINITY_DN37024_c0_g2_i1.p1 TRINITY_DN37024_c0_g2~~TRINITY_DN37024_c0_g2_i1.p1  ORF type:complete len:769 (-),score=165.92 TRINITY_DN37024_c0_g2_i1:138-2444(-)
MEDAEAGMESRALVGGALRVNTKRTQESYVKVDGIPHDVLVDGYSSRNRAFGGDMVVVKLLDRTQWRSREGKQVDMSGMPSDESAVELWEHACIGELQAQGVVVAVLNPSRERVYVGTLLLQGSHVNFVPSDPAVTRFFIPSSQCPPDVASTQRMYLCKFVRWTLNDLLPRGELCEFVGEFGNIESETAALMLTHDVDARPYSDEILAELAGRYPEGWTIPEEELEARRDLRTECIFTVDPPTAKDLDDALQCEKMPNGNYKVGVHIADVSFFIEPNELLDKQAAARATSVYLCDRVVPMLPARLCEDLCSLNPDVDRCAFSVIWELDPAGQVLDEWFGRTLIRSCWKGAYPLAQSVIDGQDPDPLSGCTITNGYTHTDCQQVIRNLWQIASTRRRDRVKAGALTALSQVKLCFELNQDGYPEGFGNYVTSSANHLVEEFMLLANQRVASYIARQFPQIALLRNHGAPLEHGLEEVAKFCGLHGIPMDTSSSKTLEESLSEQINQFHPHARRVLTHMLTKPMQQANYFCTGDMEPDEWGHYALAIDRYTHFTSPIRRYPDLVVHRLLQQAINLERAAGDPSAELTARLMATCQPSAARMVERWRQEPQSQEALKALGDLTDARQCDLSKVCLDCNERKASARKAQEGSTYVFLAVLLQSEPIVAEAVVLNVGDKYLNVIAVGFDLESKCFLEDSEALMDKKEWDGESKTLVVTWKSAGFRPSSDQAAVAEGGVTVEIRQLSVVKVLLYTKEKQVPLAIAMRLLPSQPE